VGESKILVARKDDLAFVEVIGRGSFQNAGCLKSFYQELLRNGTKRFVVDLSECTYLDSTFLGTLTGLGLALKEKAAGRLQILNAGTRNLELLQNLGLDRLFDVEIAAGNFTKPCESKELINGTPDKTREARDMIEAHQCLMDLDPRNVPKFKDVVAYLKEDLGIVSDE
jgi:anti-sigma B factor antagonist